MYYLCTTKDKQKTNKKQTLKTNDMKTKKDFTYEVFNDTTKEKMAKGEFTIEYDTQWWAGAVYELATAKCKQLAELFWTGDPAWCLVKCEDGWSTDYVNDEQ